MPRHLRVTENKRLFACRRATFKELGDCSQKRNISETHLEPIPRRHSRSYCPPLNPRHQIRLRSTWSRHLLEGGAKLTEGASC
jgi:hypothetical protein